MHASVVDAFIISFQFLSVQVAMVQDSVDLDNGADTLYQIVRQLLPNAAGTRLFGDWLPTDTRTETISYSWNPRSKWGYSDFRIVVSIHDENTKEVYQAAKADIPQSFLPPSLVIAGNDPILNEDLFKLAEKEMEIIKKENLNLSKYKSLLKLYDRADIINELI